MLFWPFWRAACLAKTGEFLQIAENRMRDVRKKSELGAG